MNLADYLSELLGQRDEVSVPGLGSFMRTRVNAYYNDAEGRFYPPYHQVTFVPRVKEDEVFAQYVADEKNISLASSKYFVEKFVNKLREDAGKGKSLFADLGSFQSGELDQLVFKPNERIPADPAFYGYQPVEIFKTGQPLPADDKKSVAEAPKSSSNQAQAEASATAVPAPRVVVQQPEYYDEDLEVKKRLSVWMIIAIVVVVLAIAVFALSKFFPSLFDGISDEYHKLTTKTDTTQAVIRHEVKKDTVKKIVVTPDTATKAVAQAKADTVQAPPPPTSRFEAVAEMTNHRKVAQEHVNHLRQLGYDAYIVENAPGTGPLIKVSVGSYPTASAADSVINLLLQKHVIKGRHAPLEIKTQTDNTKK